MAGKKKPEYCLEKSGGSSVECGGCHDDILLRGLKPLRESFLNATMARLERAGRVKKCSACNHLVVVCKECKKAMSLDVDGVVICFCCLKVAADPNEYDEYDDPEF